MTRVSDLSQSQLLISELNRANQRASVTELQVSSGKKAQYFKGLSEQAGVLFSAKRVLDRNAHYSQTVMELKQRLDIQGLSLQELEAATGDLRQAVTDALANDTGLAFMDKINAIFQRASQALNTQVNGQYIFGGTRTDVAPVNVASLAALGAAPSIPGIFENNAITASAVVDDGVKIDYGFTASDLGTGIMTALQAIKQFNDGAGGPFNGTLTAAQRTFLEGQIGTLVQVASDVTSKSARNGVVQNQVDTIEDQLSSSKVLAERFVSDIEDVDLATALTNLQQDQMALQAATRMVAEIGRLSLLDYLPVG